MSVHAGSITWAIVPFVGQAPFAIYAGPGSEPISVANASTIIDAVRSGGDAQFDYLVEAKVRPVVLLSDAASERYQEHLALRLARLSKYSREQQGAVRSGQSRSLFYLAPAASGLPEPAAVMLDSPVRVHASALSPTPVGALNAYELRTIQERFIALHGFDMRAILAVAQQQQELARKRHRPKR